MYNSVQAVFNPLQSIDSATFTGSYQAFASFTYPVRLLHIINKSDEDVTISLNGGTNDHIYVPAGSFSLYDLGTNRGNGAPALELAPSALVIKGTAGTGLVYAISVSAFTPTRTIPGQ